MSLTLNINMQQITYIWGNTFKLQVMHVVMISSKSSHKWSQEMHFRHVSTICQWWSVSAEHLWLDHLWRMVIQGVNRASDFPLSITVELILLEQGLPLMPVPCDYCPYYIHSQERWMAGHYSACSVDYVGLNPLICVSSAVPGIIQTG